MRPGGSKRAGTARAHLLVAAALSGLLGSLAVAGPGRAESAEKRILLEQGERVYSIHCVGCHGLAGDGRGPAAEMLIVKPRDFTSGIFKFRSTPNGSLPTDEDLYRTITRGVNRTSMPEWSMLPDRERFALVEYVKTFSPRWTQEAPGVPIFIPQPPAWLGSPESVARGRLLYEGLECGRCHGPDGRGDGPSALSLQPDEWGQPQRPFNFTKGALKSGASPQDVYRTFMTGLNGTAMPSYAEIFDQPDGENILTDDAWNLVSFILSLRTAPASTARAAAAPGSAPGKEPKP